MHPPHVHLFFTYSGSKLSRMTARVEPGWTHCGLMFADEHGTRYGFEARSKAGWTGPYDFSETERYIEGRGGRMIVTPPLGFSFLDAAEAYHRALRLLDTSKPYAYGQLAWIWLAKRYHVDVPRSADRMICSEGAARVLSGLGPFPVWEHPDAITPMALWHWYCEDVARSHALAYGNGYIDIDQTKTGVTL